MAGAVCAGLALVPTGAIAQEAVAPARTFILREAVPGMSAVPEQVEFGAPGPVDLEEAGFFVSTKAPDEGSKLLRGLGWRDGHFAMWIDRATLQWVGIVVQSFDRRIDGPANDDIVNQRAIAELGPEAERIDTASVPGSFSFVSSEGTTVSFRRGHYNAQVVASAGLPRQLAIDLAARQYGALPDATPRGDEGESVSYTIGFTIGQALIPVAALVMLCLGAVAVVRSRRRGSPPPPDVMVVPGSWTPPPGGWPPPPAPASPPAPPREPALAGPRRRGSTI